MNNILKLEIDWKPQNTPSLIEKITNIIKLQFLDLKRSLSGTGNYRLSGEYKKFKMAESAYRSKSKEERDQIFKKFLATDLRKTSPDYIHSSDGRFSVLNKAKSTARKPGQRKRPRNEKTCKRH